MSHTYELTTPAGPVTVDHECTMRSLSVQLRAMHVRHAHARNVQRVREIIDHVDDDGAVQYLRIRNGLISSQCSGAIALPR